MTVNMGESARFLERMAGEVRRIVRRNVFYLSACFADGVMVVRLSVRKLIMRVPMAEVIFDHQTFLDERFECAVQRATVY